MLECPHETQCRVVCLACLTKALAVQREAALKEAEEKVEVALQHIHANGFPQWRPIEAMHHGIMAARQAVRDVFRARAAPEGEEEETR